MPHPQKHIVVLGGGFGGLNFTQHFHHPDARITLIDQNNHHLFQPLLYQVATAGLSMPDIAEPLRSLFSGRPDVTTLMAKVETIDLENRAVLLSDKSSLPYDYLVIALGAVTGYFDHPEWENHATGLKSMRDAMVIRRQVLTAFERAEQEPDESRRQKLMNLVVVGGGPTGVELAGALAELTKRVFRKDFRRLDPEKARIILIHPHAFILNTFPAPLPLKALAALKKLGVEVWLQSRVEHLEEGKVRIQHQTPEGPKESIFEAETIIWTAGVRANPIVATLLTSKDQRGRILVKPDCSLENHPEVFALGDCVFLTDSKGREVPGLAAAAMQMGRYVATVLKDRFHEKPHNTPFLYQDRGSMATIGRSAAVAVIGGLKLSGFIAWVLWLTVHLLLLIGFRDKINVLIQWLFSYIRYNNGARIIVDLGRRSIKDS
jgi:NADH:ubiquinone reductase (H+-translocating)